MTERQSPPRGPAPERPRMGPTRPSTLIVAGLAAAGLAWLLISSFYQEIPELPWLPTVIITGLAVLEGYAAANTQARIERRPGREPVDPLSVARFVVLAKASSMAGAIFAGFYAGLTGWLLVERTRSAENDVPAASATLAASLLLVAAALWLERSCRVPKRPDDEQDSADSAD
jgi:hypothetical protein